MNSHCGAGLGLTVLCFLPFVLQRVTAQCEPPNKRQGKCRKSLPCPTLSGLSYLNYAWRSLSTAITVLWPEAKMEYSPLLRQTLGGEVRKCSKT